MIVAKSESFHSPQQYCFPFLHEQTKLDKQLNKVHESSMILRLSDNHNFVYFL